LLEIVGIGGAAGLGQIIESSNSDLITLIICPLKQKEEIFLED
jgi:hypothetical protein